MEFDKSRVYTAVNAEELKVGSTVICADSLLGLKNRVKEGTDTTTLVRIMPDNNAYRFQIISDEEEPYALAYLVEEPKEPKLQWTDLKIGDIIRKGHSERMVIGIDAFEDIHRHILLGSGWLNDKDLKDWEKVEDEEH